MIEVLHSQTPFIKGVKLARNAGHQNALLAGLTLFKDAADCFITIDADLQDDIRAIREMVEKFSAGLDIIYGVRKKRQDDSFFKKSTALSFYNLMKKLGVEIIYNHADYRLSSKRILEELLKFKETNLFLRGIYPLLGFKSASVYYDRIKRQAANQNIRF